MKSLPYVPSRTKVAELEHKIAEQAATIERYREALLKIVEQAVIGHVDDTPVYGLAVAALNQEPKP